MSATGYESLWSSCCPLDGKPLVARERVRVESVPSTVPSYLTRDQQARYRSVEQYEVVSCSRGHKFKRSSGSLSGMQT